MSKVLIVNNMLTIGGGEKLVMELVRFALKNNIQPTVLIVDNLNTEYYDKELRELNVKVVRVILTNIHKYRNPFKIIKSIYWKINLRFFSSYLYDSVHINNLSNVIKIYADIKHDKRFFWHVGNIIQFDDEVYPFPEEIFTNKKDTVICTNKLQLEELKAQYGLTQTPITQFKLFIDDNH